MDLDLLKKDREINVDINVSQSSAIYQLLNSLNNVRVC
jgi:hypothetical protein